MRSTRLSTAGIVICLAVWSLLGIPGSENAIAQVEIKASDLSPLAEGGLTIELLDLEPEALSQIETRAAYGFPIDPQFVASLAGSGADAGTDIGIPLTTAERH